MQIPPKGHGASETVMYEVAKRLSKDIQISIFSKSASFFQKRQNYNINFYYLNRILSIADSLFFNRKLYVKFVLKILKKQYFDALQTNNPFFTELINAPESKLIFHAHNAPGGGFEIDSLEEERKSRAFRMLEECDKILCVSNYVRKALLPYVNDKSKLHVILNGVDTKKFVPLQKENIVLCVGKIQPEKGQIYLLKAFKKINTDWKLLIAGYFAKKVPGGLNYSKECLKFQGKNIRFLVFVSEEELIKLYGKAKILVCPSMWQEPFGLINLEAMSSGCATIATNVGGIPEIIKDGETGFLVPPKYVDAIREKLMTIMNDDDLLNRISNKAREEAVKRFDWNIIAKEYLNFYRSLM